MWSPATEARRMIHSDYLFHASGSSRKGFFFFFLFVREIASSQWFTGSLLVILGHVWISFRELILMITYLSSFLTQTRLWLLLFFPSPVVFYMFMPHTSWNLMKKKRKKRCYIICIVNLIMRMNGVFMASDACAANPEPPTHKWSWKSSILSPPIGKVFQYIQLDNPVLCAHMLVCLCI